MTSEFKRKTYSDTMTQIKVPAGMRSRILNAETGSRRPVHFGRRGSMILVTCLLIVLVSGTALGVQASGRGLKDYFMDYWDTTNAEVMPASQLKYVDNLMIPVGISQTEGDVTVTVESALYCDGCYWILVNAEGMDFKNRGYAFGTHEFQILTADGQNVARNLESLTGLNRDGSLMQMMLYGELEEDVTASLDGQEVTFALTVRDVMTGTRHLDQVAAEGCWSFQFPVVLNGSRQTITVDDFTAEYDPVFEYDKEQNKQVDVKDVELTAGAIRFKYNDEGYTGPLPRILMKTGGDIGVSSGHLAELEDGWFDCEYRWVMPVDTSQIAALQFGNTVIEIE